MRIQSQTISLPPPQKWADTSGRSASGDASGQTAVWPREEEERFQPKAGFGKDTMSSGAAAIVTITSNLKNARELVPSVEEAMKQIRARFEELAREAEAQRARLQETNAPPAPPESMESQTQTIPDPVEPEASQPPASPSAASAPAFFTPAPARQSNVFDTGNQLDLSA